MAYPTAVYNGVINYTSLVYGNKLWWSIYGHDTAWHYKFSNDNGNTWSAEQELNLGVDTDDAGMILGAVDPNTNVLHLITGDTFIWTTYYRACTLNSDGSITWLAALQTIQNDIIYFVRAPDSIVISPDGYPYVSYYRSNGGNAVDTVARSTTKDGTWTNENLYTESGASVYRNFIRFMADGSLIRADVNPAIIHGISKWVSGTTWTGEAGPYATDSFKGISPRGTGAEIIYSESGNIYSLKRDSSGNWDAAGTLLEAGVGDANPGWVDGNFTKGSGAFWWRSADNTLIKKSITIADWFVYTKITPGATYPPDAFCTYCGDNKVGLLFVDTDWNLKFHYFDLEMEGGILECAFNQSILTAPASATWTEVTDDLMALNTKRGRMHELDRMEAGTAVFQINNDDGNWWRYNTTGTFYLANGSTEVIKPLTLIRLRKLYNAVYYPVWYGYIESLEPDWVDDKGGMNPVMNLQCVDIFKSFSRYYLSPIYLTVDANNGQPDVVVENASAVRAGDLVYLVDGGDYEVATTSAIVDNTITMTGNLAKTYHIATNAYLNLFGVSELSGTRINKVLNSIGWSTTAREIDTGVVTVTALYPSTGGTNAMDHLYKVAEAEAGIIFATPSGSVAFHDRNARSLTPYTYT
jgi:hypothetical protein